MAKQPIGITFSEELQKQMFGADKVDFPIDFDDAWGWVGYSRKDAAVRHMQNTLKIKLDYIEQAGRPFHNSVESSPARGSSPNKYFLTTEGFKVFCMAAGTDKGDAVRRYFVKVEEDYRRRFTEQAVKDVFPDIHINVAPAQPPSNPAIRTQLAKVVREKRCELKALDADRHLFTDPGLLELASRQIQAELRAALAQLAATDAPTSFDVTSVVEPLIASIAPPVCGALVQSKKGLRGLLYFKHRPVYSLSPLSEAQKLTAVRYQNYPGRSGKPDVHPESRFALREVMRLLLPCDPSIGIYIDGACLASGALSAVLIAELGTPRVNKLIGLNMASLGWRKTANYRTPSGHKTGTIYEFDGGTTNA
jgi:hypothetical protein